VPDRVQAATRKEATVTKTRIVVAAVVMAVVSIPAAAFATDPTPESIVNAGAASLQSSLLAIAVAVLPYAAVLAAVIFGWRFVRKVVHT
jgi:hypothetical protein